jgi:hypothetical protein
MASITLTTVRAAVRELGDFPLSPKFSNDFVDREIQTAWTALHRLVEKVNEGYWDKSGTTPTVASQAYAALPSDCWKVKGVDILDGTEYRELRQIAIGERNRYGQTTDKPDAYRLTERGIDLFPTPNAVFTLRVTYARKVTTLAGTAVTVDEEWHDFVVWSAILKISASEERPTGDYQAAIDRASMAIADSATGRRQAEPEYVILREYAPDWGYF